MKFNHLTLSMRKHVSSPGFSVLYTENMSYLPEVTKRPQLSPDPRQEPWSHTIGPDQLWGRGPAAGEQSATGRAWAKGPQASRFQAMETCSGSGPGKEEKCLVSSKQRAGFRAMGKTI